MISLPFSEAVEGYFLYAESRGLSPHTLSDYGVTFRKFAAFLEADPPICQIEYKHIERFLASMSHLKKKTRLNYHTGLSALWTWAIKEGLVEQHIVRRVDAPRPERMAIIPFSRADVQAMLNACDRSALYRRHFDYRPQSYELPSRLRNRAIILLLLDTGLRNSEACAGRLRDLDLKNRRLVLMGKGSRQRVVSFSSRTAKSVWRYLITRPDRTGRSPIFASEDGFETALTRFGLSQLIGRIGQRAGVPDAHPHRFRHTFAINFLRNNGNIYALQELLGHSSLRMVRRYLALAEQDTEAAHRLASPVANWNL